MKIKYIQACCLLFLMVLLPLKAQTPQKNIILERDESGMSKTYIATDYVSLKPGFKYTSQQSDKFHAYLDRFILFPPTDNSYKDINGNITSDPTKGGAVGNIPAQFDVSPSGAATYNIPIECPPGLNGIEPNISIAYNSQVGGNGSMGVGWNIAGISAISLVSSTLFNNESGQTSGINFYETGKIRFALDGNTLIASNNISYGKDGCKYETENKTYAEIYSYGQVNTGVPEYFIVKTKDNITIEYAHRAYAEHYQSVTNNYKATPNPYLWLITKITDDKGNYMNFVYTAQSTSSTSRVVKPEISRIDYGANTNSSNPFYGTLNFHYSARARSKDHIEYIARARIVHDRKLDRISVSSQGNLLRTYRFTYDYKNPKYYLKEIKLSGEDDKEYYNPLTFEWGEKDIRTDEIDYVAIPSIEKEGYELKERRFYAADIDGDGFADLIQLARFQHPRLTSPTHTLTVSKNTPQVLLKNGKHIAFPVFNKEEMLSTSLRSGFALTNDRNKNLGYIGAVLFPSFEGGSNKRTIIVPSYNGSIKYVYFNDLVSQEYLTHELSATSQITAYTFGDINNDGIDEIISLEKESGKGYIFHIKKGAQNNTPNYRPELGDTYEKQVFDSRVEGVSQVFIADFDNDGMNDIMVVGERRTIIYFADHTKMMNGNRIFQSRNPVTITRLKSSNGFIRLGDFTGNGLIDIIYNEGCSTNWYMIENIGMANEIIGEGVKIHHLANFDAMEECYTDKNDDKDVVIVMDFNHDGKDDIIMIDSKYNNKKNYENSTITWYQSEGTSFVKVRERIFKDENFSFNAHNTIGDFNGDGYTDLFSFETDLRGLIGSQKKNNTGIVYNMSSVNYDEDKIVTIKDAFNNRTQIYYQPLTYSKHHIEGTDFYIRQSNAVYPTIDFTVPIPCVAKVTMFNGNNKADHRFLYTYEGAKANLTGKGFLGFEKIKSVDEYMYIGQTITTEMDYNYYLPKKQIITLNSSLNNKEISRQEIYYTNSKSGKIYNSFPNKVIEVSTLENLQTTQEIKSRDGWGNVLESQTTKGILITTEKFTYGKANSSALCPNKLISHEIIQRLGNESHTTLVQYSYDSKGNLISEKVNPSHVNTITTEYQNYDVYGNPKTINLKANGKTITKKFEYSKSGRFVTKETNALGEVTTYEWNEINCTLKSKKNRLGSTMHVYNSFGDLTETIYPNGNKMVSVLQWLPANNYGGIYYSHYQNSGCAPIQTWYNSSNQEVLQETFGLNEKKINVFTEYYIGGKLKRKSLPTFNSVPGESSSNWIIYEYYVEDGYRPKSITNGLGATKYTYNGRTTKIESPEGTTETTLNDYGLTSVSKVNGKSVTYQYYPSGLLKSATPQGGKAVTYEYDAFDNRTKISDPNAGTVHSQYDGFGKLIRTSQKVHLTGDSVVTNYVYSTNGLLQNTLTTGKSTRNIQYIYDNYNRVTSIKAIQGTRENHIQHFTYDDFDRITGLEEKIGIRTYTKSYEYDIYGNLIKEVYPSGYFLINTYDEYSNLIKVHDSKNNLITEIKERNAYGQITRKYNAGNLAQYTYDTYGRLTRIVDRGINETYRYNNKNNLIEKYDHQNMNREVYTYDSFNRLTDYDYVNFTTGNLIKKDYIKYDTKGNISEKSDLPSYTLSYENQNNQLSFISPVPSSFPAESQTITYTDFKKVERVTEGKEIYQLEYGVSNQRISCTYVSYEGDYLKTRGRYYVGNYEEEVDNNTRKIHYLGDAVYIQNKEKDSLLWISRDNIGSVIALSDEQGKILQKYAYDPWGKRRDSDYWLEKERRTHFIINRGFTGHEHTDLFGLINMNGRVYDPYTAQFLSPDPYIQDPSNWLNYNRYMYAYNNPFKYTDPSGEIAWFVPVIIGAVIGAYSGGVLGNDGNFNPAKWDYGSGKTWGYMLGGAVVGGVSGYAGWAIAGSGIPMANTASIAGSSLINSVGTWAYTEGKTPVSISFGVGSYNFTKGTFGYLGKKGNSALENMGYSFGALANITDAFTLFRGGGQNVKVNSASTKGEHEPWGHSSITDENGISLVSVGPDNQIQKGATLSETWQNSIVEADVNWSSYLGEEGTWSIELNNVSTNAINKYSSRITRWDLLLNSCVGHTSRSLWRAGVPNVYLFHPHMLNAQLLIRQLGIYSSPYIYQISK